MDGHETGRTTTAHENPWFAVTHEQRGHGAGASHWYRVVGADSAMIVPITDDGEIVVLHGIRDTTGPEPLYELPCGALDDGEDDAAAAARELEEETGYTAQRLIRIGEFFASPGISPTRTAVFEARGLTPGTLGLEPGEQWTTVQLTADRFTDLIATGHVRDAGTVAAFFFWLSKR